MTNAMADAGRPATPMKHEDEQLVDLFDGLLCCTMRDPHVEKYGKSCRAPNLRMDESASQLVAESADKEQLQTMVQELVAANAKMKQALDNASPKPPPRVSFRLPPKIISGENKNKAPQEDDTQLEGEEDQEEDEKEEKEQDQVEDNDAEEQEEEEEEGDGDAASTTTPRPKSVKPALSTPPPPPVNAFEAANSTSHRKEWMSFGRKFSEGDGLSKFPELASLWDASKEEHCLQSWFATHDML